MERWLSIGDTAGGAVAHPDVPWMFSVPSFAIWAILAVVFASRLVKEGRLPFAALVFLSATSMSWQEFYADWGAKLVYSPAFSLMPWESSFTTPNKPWFVVPCYGCYYVAIYTFQVWLVGKVRRAKPSWGAVVPVLLVSVPFFYLWDFLIEGVAASEGWWTYLDPIHPVLSTSHGQLPLLHPIVLFTFYGTVMTYLLAQRNSVGAPSFEGIGGVSSMPAGPSRELARLALWIVVMNVVYGLLLTIPCMIVRVVIQG